MDRGATGIMEILIFAICFGASLIGAICGVGGGIIIKPLVDSFGIMSVSAVSFCSGCTVLAMTTYAVTQNLIKRKSSFQLRISLPLSIGAAVGGVIGKELFSYVKARSGNENMAGLWQAVALLLVIIGTFAYTLFKDKINTKQVSNLFACVVIGLLLGVMSSFLGIGGGPMNIVVLYFFFSMTTKVAAVNSLYIIFFSQIANLIATFVTKSVPADLMILLLILMIVGGIAGGIVGRKINTYINDKTVEKLFLLLMLLMIGVNIFNIVKFTV